MILPSKFAFSAVNVAIPIEGPIRFVNVIFVAVSELAFMVPAVIELLNVTGALKIVAPSKVEIPDTTIWVGLVIDALNVSVEIPEVEL